MARGRWIYAWVNDLPELQPSENGLDWNEARMELDKLLTKRLTLLQSHQHLIRRTSEERAVARWDGL